MLFYFLESNWNRLILFSLITGFIDILVGFNHYFGSIIPSFYTVLLILPAYLLIFIMIGYSLKVIKISINNDNELPIFNKWFSMLVNGIKVYVLWVLYLIIPTIVAIIGLVLTFDLTNIKINFIHLSPIAIFVFLISALLYIVSLVFYEIALANMAYHGNLRAGLNLKEIIGIIKKIGWGKYLSVLIVVFTLAIISLLISYITISIPIISLLLIFLVSPYLGLVRSRIIGLIYKEAL
jgi:Protein of unknown function (DUF4013)